MTTVREIIENKEKELEGEKAKESIEQLKEKIKTLPPTRDFFGSISKDGINIIAETKIKGAIGNTFNGRTMLDLAEYYKSTGISAISVLSDEKYFKGNKETMRKIRDMISKPILRKDFIIDEYQIYQSRAYGADAILLMSSVLPKGKIKRFIEIGKELGIECLVEFFDEDDLANIPSNARIYGRNYRKLKLDTDLSDKHIHLNIYDAPTYIDKIPQSAVKVAESCIKSPEDIKYLREKGFNAFLIGTAISKSPNPKKAIEQLIFA